MSEFEKPGQSVSASESIAPSESAETSPEWQTVDFPGAISVDSIPAGGEIVPPIEAASTTEAADAQMDVVELNALVQTLQQENHLLREQVVQLENDLTEVQIQTQFDGDQHQTVFPPAASSHPAQAMLVASQEQVSRLFQELELSHQANQRQQILVETLQTELHKSRQYISDLEQNVAVLQQQCATLGQQRAQAESDCHDLRLRLHRQQQQTLQFKAALERSLETAAHVPTPLEEAVAESTVEVEQPTQTALTQPTVRVNNPPVQPWSAPSNRGTKHFNDSLLKPIAQLFSQDEAPESPTPTASSPELPEVIETSMSESDLALEALGDEVPVPTPDVELENEGAIAGTPEAVPSVTAEQGLETSPSETTTQVLWQDLAKLIETVAPSVAETLRTNPPAEMLQLQSEGMSEPTYATNLRLDVSETIAQASLRTAERESALPEAAASLQNIPGMPKDSPSPTLYPKRVTKKRESLAAVELPTFPRKES